MKEPDVLDGALVLLAVVGEVDGAEPPGVPPDGDVVGVCAGFGPNICLDGPVLTGLGPKILVVCCCGCFAVTDGDVSGVTAGGVLVVIFGATPVIAGFMDGGTAATEAVTFGIPVLSTPAVSGFLSS